MITNPQEGLSLSALAKALGRAKSGLHKLAKRGQIPMLPSGRFDLDAVKAALAANVDPGRSRSAQGATASPSRKSTAGTRPVVATEADAREAVTLVRRVLAEEGGPAEASITFDAARTAETILKARERDLKMAVMAGKLVDAATVHSAVFNMARQERDALQNWPARVGPIIAAEFGIDHVGLVLALEKHVRAFLAERSEPRVRLP